MKLFIWPGAAGSLSATDPCIHCGFCLPSCASYRVLGTEMDSPRGRIHMLKAIEAGELALDGPRWRGIRFLSGLPGLRQRLPRRGCATTN